MKHSLRDLKALLVDVFGTLVDWRSSIAREARQIPAQHVTSAPRRAYQRQVPSTQER
jgi:FMN phosphatase YigB (HAD superfamily)